MKSLLMQQGDKARALRSPDCCTGENGAASVSSGGLITLKGTLLLLEGTPDEVQPTQRRHTRGGTRTSQRARPAPWGDAASRAGGALPAKPAVNKSRETGTILCVHGESQGPES